MDTINIELTTAEINYILNVIAQRPYTECYKLINKISDQIEHSKDQTTAK